MEGFRGGSANSSIFFSTPKGGEFCGLFHGSVATELGHGIPFVNTLLCLAENAEVARQPTPKTFHGTPPKYV